MGFLIFDDDSSLECILLLLFVQSGVNEISEILAICTINQSHTISIGAMEIFKSGAFSLAP